MAKEERPLHWHDACLKHALGAAGGQFGHTRKSSAYIKTTLGKKGVGPTLFGELRVATKHRLIDFLETSRADVSNERAHFQRAPYAVPAIHVLTIAYLYLPAARSPRWPASPGT